MTQRRIDALVRFDHFDRLFLRMKTRNEKTEEIFYILHAQNSY